MQQTAALLFAGLCATATAFQSALMLGAPWGAWGFGGRWPGRLPWPARLLAGLNALLLAGAAVAVLAKAGVAWPSLQAWAAPWTGAVVAYCGVGAVLNGVTPSRRERRLWWPVAVGMLVSSGVATWP